MKANHKHYTLLLLAIATTIVCVVVYIILYRTVRSQAAESGEMLRELALEDERKKHEQDIVSIYSKTASDREFIKNTVVSQSEIVKFIESVENIGPSSGSSVEFSNIEVESFPSADENALAHFKAQVGVKGSWENVMRALILIENMPYSLSVHNIKLSATSPISTDTSKTKTTKETKRNIWNMTLEIKVLTKR